MELMDGAMADGGGELTVVSVVDLVVALEVDSVTMACAATEVVAMAMIQLIIIFFIHV
jgi:hypothetical protein